MAEAAVTAEAAAAVAAEDAATAEFADRHGLLWLKPKVIIKSQTGYSRQTPLQFVVTRGHSIIYKPAVQE